MKLGCLEPVPLNAGSESPPSPSHQNHNRTVILCVRGVTGASALEAASENYIVKLVPLRMSSVRCLRADRQTVAFRDRHSNTSLTEMVSVLDFRDPRRKLYTITDVNFSKVYIFVSSYII